jgi:endonuclease/exonuclease/phosphatase family metal-dependent hydrolase
MHQGKHEPRAAVFARLHTKGGEVMFVSTHLDHLGEQSDRPVQATAIMTSMQSVNIPAILAGDFNCTPGSEPLNIVEAHFTRVTDDAPSFPVVSPKSKIDHIFVHPAARWRIIETHVMDEEMASDHRPVVATLELLPTAR